MKNVFRLIGIISIALIIGFSFAACDDGNSRGGPGGGGSPHTHTYSSTWSSNATQHWRECTAGDGAETGRANHTGNPCNVCGYSSGGGNVPGAPTGVTATAQSSSSILITWDAVPGAGWYVVYRSLSANGTYNLLVGIAATQYTSSPLPANTTYYFKVAASINGNIGPLSSYVSATTLPR